MKEYIVLIFLLICFVKIFVCFAARQNILFFEQVSYREERIHYTGELCIVSHSNNCRHILLL